MHARTLYDKLWDSHVVREEGDGTALLYIDRHLVHEVTSPQAYEGLKLAGRKPWRVESIVATADHNTPTTHWDEGIRDPISRTAGRDARREHPRVRRQGLFPVSRPAPGHRPRDRPGAGRDAARHDGRLRRFAHQHARRVRLPRVRHRHLRSRARARHAVPGARRRRRRCWSASTARLPRGVTAKDLVLAIIGRIGTAGGTGYAIEFAGSAIRALSMEGRMTVCNMAIEAGARAGMVAVDETTHRVPARAGRSRRRATLWDARRRVLAHAGERSGREVRHDARVRRARRSSRR